MGNKKNIVARLYLENLLGIRSSKSFPNDKQEAIDSKDDILK